MSEEISNTVTTSYERLKNTGSVIKENPMTLIIFPLFLMIFGGAISNNLIASGINPNNSASINGYPCVLGQGNCSAIAFPSTGNLNPCANGNCNLSKIGTFSFLNQNSPFTYLLEGNLVGFLTSTFTTPEQINQYHSGNTICIPLVGNRFANVTNSTSIFKFECFGSVNYNAINNNTVVVPLNASSNYGNNSIWNLNGCPDTYAHCGYPMVGQFELNYTQSIISFYGIYIANGTTITAAHGCSIYGSSYACYLLFPTLFGNNPAFTCPNTASVNGTGVNLEKTFYYCLLPTSNPATFNVNNTFAFYAMIAGIILLAMGLGLTVGFSILTNGGTLGINPQGTKLAQVIGLGLVVWSFISSEFSQWILDIPLVGTTVIFPLLTIIFFLGLYWLLSD